jgi:hypothetical protein
MRKLIFAAVIGGSLLIALVAGSFAFAKDDHGGNVKSRLVSYNETPLTLSTTGRGEFRAHIDMDAKTIAYTLTYSGLEGGNTLFAHIHLGRPATTGGVAAFLCGGGSKPNPCPNVGGTVTGTITEADVIGPANQGIAAPTAFDELVRAIRAGATYVNVHTTTYGGGEIRGQLRGHGRGHD